MRGAAQPALLALSFCFLAASCSEDNGNDEGNTLKVGILAPFTGPNARVGEEARYAFTMALETVNNQIGGRDVEPVWVDSESDPDKAAAAYTAAATKDDIVAGFFNWHSDVALSCIEVAAEHRVPHFFTMGATSAINDKYASDPDKYGIWSKGWPDPVKLTINYVTAIEDAIAAGSWSPGEKKAAVYGEDTNWGRGFGDGIAAQLEAEGWTIVGPTYLPQHGTDFSTEIAAMRAQNPTLLAGTFASDTLMTFISQVRTGFQGASYQPLIIADGLGWRGDWYQRLQDQSDYIVDQIPRFATAEALAFVDDFESRWGILPSPSAAGQAYDYGRFFIEILQRAHETHGEVTRETVGKVLKDQVFTGDLTYTDGILMTEYKYTSESAPDPVVGKEYYTFPVMQYVDGEGVIVWPEEWKAEATDQLTVPQ